MLSSIPVMLFSSILLTIFYTQSLALHLGKRGDASGCGKPLPSNVSPGGSSQTGKVTSGGRSRDYLIHVPASYKTDTPVPLILSFHGRTKDAAEQEELSQFSNPAYNPDAIAVYPQGVSVSIHDVLKAAAVTSLQRQLYKNLTTLRTFT